MSQGSIGRNLNPFNPVQIDKLNQLQKSMPDGTHVTSIIFGQHGSEVRGIAPACRGLIIPIFRYSEEGELLLLVFFLFQILRLFLLLRFLRNLGRLF